MEPKGSPLTDREFWRSYWKGNSSPGEKSVFFESRLADFPRAPARFLEIGGFPGSFAAFFRKRLGYDVSLLDFHQDAKVVAAVESVHGLEPGSIQCIEGDLLEKKPDPSYDVVFSAGFVEHFRDPEVVLKRHVDYLKPGGTLWVSVPNLLGVSGWLQAWLDPKNYAVHDLNCMDPENLRVWAQRAGLVDVEVSHFGVPHFWLDHFEKRSIPVQMAFRTSSKVLALLKRLSLTQQGRVFSPYLVLKARRALSVSSKS